MPVAVALLINTVCAAWQGRHHGLSSTPSLFVLLIDIPELKLN